MASPRTSPVPTSAEPKDPWAWITSFAFALLVVLVLARATMMEAAAQVVSSVSGPGPAASLVLDLICCVPAMLVLIRRVVDSTYVIRAAWSFVPLAALAGWMALSTTWSVDRFAAATGAAHWATAAVVVWSATQLVRSWARLRLLAALLAGLLLVYCIHGLYYKLVEAPSDIELVNKDPDRVLREQGFEPGSFMAEQFLAKVRRAELIGFNYSPNSFAAVIATLAVLAMGGIAQRWQETGGRDYGIGFLAVLLVLAAWMIAWTDSKTAYLTPLLAAGALVALRYTAGWRARRPGAAYLIGVGAVVAGAAAFVLIGVIRHGDLLISSLTFRWNYWIGAGRIFVRHAFAGVGWGNFPAYYLEHRVPQASEEIKDPHNFVVRFFVELGVIGGVLLLAWLLRLAWELTRPNLPPAPKAAPAGRPTVILLGIVGAAFAVNLAAGLDYGQAFDYLLLETVKRAMYFGALYVAAVATAVVSLNDARTDARPAPWLLYGLLTAIGVFFLHNLMDFSLFEPGPMMLLATLIGAGLGARFPSLAGRRRHRWVSGAALAAGFGAWVVAAVVLVVPTVDGERLAYRAAEAERANNMLGALDLSRVAAAALPMNADYPYRAAGAAVRAGEPQGVVRALLGDAIRANPRVPDFYQRRAELEFANADRNALAVVDDYRRALALDPHNVPMRLRFAEVLERLGQPADAFDQFEKALKTTWAMEGPDPRREDVLIHFSYARALERAGRVAPARDHYRKALAAHNALPPNDRRRLRPDDLSIVEAALR